MTELFTRYHEPPGGKVTFDKKGKPVWVHDVKCWRCGGAGGADIWKFTGWTCYRCGGTGWERKPAIEKLYTVEELAKFDAIAAKKAAKKEAARVAAEATAKAEADARREAFWAAHGELIAKANALVGRDTFIDDVARKATERAEISEKAEAALKTAVERLIAEDTRKAASGWVGEIGERIEVEATVERVADFIRSRFNGYGQERVYIITLRTAEGNALVTKTPSFYAEKGSTLKLRGTVREHIEYQGEKETRLERVKEL